MKNVIKHIASYLLLSGVIFALSSQVYAQTPAGTRIDNIATVRYQLLNGIPLVLQSDTAKIFVEGWGTLSLNKTVSHDSARSGDTVQFKIVAGYSGNLSASQVMVLDTVPTQFSIVKASKGTVSGNIVSWNAGTITSTTPDSVIITVVVKTAIAGRYLVKNTAYATDSIGTVVLSSADIQVNILQSESCMLQIENSIKKIIGNGLQWAVIKARITDTLGVAKPDGTPVFFSADMGKFSNGKDTITHHTVNGYAIDSLNASLISATHVEAKVVVQLLSLCNASDTIGVEFYPGAISGIVKDHVAKKFYKGAFVRLIDSTTNVLIDADTTRDDGKFLMFVPKTGTYRVDVSASDKFELSNTVTTYVPVDITGSTTHIIPNKNSISGTVYYWISNSPIYIANMPIELFDITAGDNKAVKGGEVRIISKSVLKTVTDGRGVYEFVDIKPGKYKVVLGASELNGLATITIPENGYYILNGNIPVEITSVPTIEKSGSTEVIVGDTAQYSIVIRNPNAFMISNVNVVDTLNADMEFVNASHSGIYDPMSHSITWKIGSIDSAYKEMLSVTVRIAIGSTAKKLLNKATLFALQVFPVSDTAVTIIKNGASHSILKSVNKDSATVGDTLQYRIVVKNTGTALLRNVMVTDTVDNKTMSLIVDSSHIVLLNNIVTVSVDTLKPGDSSIVTVRTRIHTADVNGFKNTAYAGTDLTPTISSSVLTSWYQTIVKVPSHTITKSVNKDSATVGDTLQYRIIIKNTGTAPLPNVVVADTIDTQTMSLIVDSSHTGLPNNIVMALIDTLNPGDSSVVTVRTRIHTADVTGFKNTAYASTDLTPTISSTVLTSWYQTIVKVPSHSITKSVNTDSAALGDTLQYRIVVKNTGTIPLPNVVVTDTIDAQTLSVLLVSSNTVLQNNIMIASADTLQPSDSVVVSVIARVKETNILGFRNTAFAITSLTPITSSTVLTVWNQSVNPNVANLILNKYVSKSAAVNGDTIQYTIRIKNNGTQKLTNVVVIDTLPKQVSKNTILYANGTIDNNIMTFDIGPMEIGGSDSVVIVSTVSGSPYIPEQVTNIAYAKANETSLQHAEASFTSLIGTLDKLLLTMSVSSPTAYTGDSLNYVLRVTNVSNRKLTHVIVRDPVPFQLENIRIELPHGGADRSAKVSIVPLSESGMTFGDSLRLEGSVVMFMKDTINVGEVDSFYIKSNIRLDRPNFELILNTGFATTDQTEQIIAQAVTLIEPRTNKTFQMQLTKRVSKDTVHIGDTMSYVIHLKNITAEPLTKIIVVDTLPPQIINPRVIGNGELNGNVVTYEVDFLGANKTDSIIIVGQLRPYEIHDGELVLNYAFANAFQNDEQTAFALFVAKTDPACRIQVNATPEKIIGNGRSKSYIEVLLTNTLGYPKPDGTPVVLTTTIGQFTNGQSMRVLYSKDGKVSDSLQATIAGTNLVNAMAIASADDGQGCKAKDTVQIVFFPGAIEGTVIDHRTNLPVLGAMVRAYSKTTDSLVGQIVTKQDGYYLFPVAKSDSFRVFITTVNEFGREITVETEVTVNVSGAGDPPTPNQNSVSGAVYYLVSREPIPAANLTIVLQQFIPGGVSKSGSQPAELMSTVDSVNTDSAGTYKFDGIPAGQFRLTLIHPTITSYVDLVNSGNGQYVINANIAVVLNPNIIFDKSGPARIAMSDTAKYTITLKNTGTLSTTNTVVTDSLHWTMKFVSATGGGVYQPASHRIIWNVGKLDSLTLRSFDVKVRFVDTLLNSTASLNRASISSNQTTVILDSVPTLLFLPPTMRLWKESNVHQANPGDTVVYSIQLKNVSGSFADSIVVSDKLPSQVQHLRSSVQYYHSVPSSVETDTVSYSGTAHAITWKWKRDTVFVGDSATITVVARVRSNLEPGTHTYTNVASMAWNGGILSSDTDSLSNATVRSIVSFLKISKQALRKVVEIGDIATYVVTVTNVSGNSSAHDIQVVDKIPFGFRYMNGSTFIDTMRIADPTGRKELLWLLKDSLAAGASVRFVYRLAVGAGAVEGNGINTAQAFAVSQFGTPMVSAEVAERIEIRRGVFSTHGLIIGKVFFDDNQNKYQDSTENGVKGIELMMEDGTRIVTGDDGKYSVPDVLPGEHVIRVRTHTLPKEAFLEMGYNDFARDSTSRFVNVTESGIARVDFYLARNIVRPDSLVLSQSIAKIGDFSIQRIALPRNIVFIEDKRLASMKLTGLNFEVGKAVLKPEAFITLKQLADILREYPDQPLIIAGHTDSMKIATKEFPNNKILSMARAMAVKYYLVEREGINVDRIRIEGHGETRPVATNKSIDGRSLNRRVEFYFTPSTEEMQITEMPVAIEIPVEYTGTENITKVDFRDVLNPAMRYVKGSATFGGMEAVPMIDGQELHWTLTNLGQNFKYKLRYTVMIQRPQQYDAITLKSTSASICYFVGDSALHCIDTLTTVNEAAIAIKGRAVNFIMSGVLFDVGKASLRSTALSSLETTAKFLKEDPSATALIEGHTDSSPMKTKEFPSNIELSHARANTIKQKLVSNFGIAPERLKTVGYGEFRPLATNETKDGRQVNRRIEMRVVRSEFTQKVIPEGGIDSSRYVVETLLPKHSPNGIDSLLRDKSKERYMLKLDIQRKVKRNTVSMMILDTIPAGLILIPKSVTTVRGIDSVNVKGKVLTMYCSRNDSMVQLYYITEVSEEGSEETMLTDDYTVRKIQSDGTIVEEKAATALIEIRKKRMIVRNQR